MSQFICLHTYCSYMYVHAFLYTHSCIYIYKLFCTYIVNRKRIYAMPNICVCQYSDIDKQKSYSLTQKIARRKLFRFSGRVDWHQTKWIKYKKEAENKEKLPPNEYRLWSVRPSRFTSLKRSLPFSRLNEHASNFFVDLSITSNLYSTMYIYTIYLMAFDLE